MFTNVNRPSAVDVLRPFVTGDMFYADSTTTLAKLPIGSETQVLNVATGIPTWTSTISLTGLTVKDNTFNIVGNVDDTKRLKFEVDAQSTLTRLTIDTGAQTVDRTLTVPVLTGDATLAVLSEAQTFTGAKTFSSTVTLDAETASRIVTTDASKNLDTPAAISTAQSLTLSTATGNNLTVSSTAESETPASNAFYCAGGVAAASIVIPNGGTSLSLKDRSGSGNQWMIYGSDVQLVVNYACEGETTPRLTQFSVFDRDPVATGDNVYGRFQMDTSSNLRLDLNAAGAASIGSIYMGLNGNDCLRLYFSGGNILSMTGSIALPTTTGTTLTVSSTQDSSSKDTGSIVTEGGLGVEKAIYAGASINATTGLFSGDYSASAGMTFKAADASAASIAFRTATNSATRWELIKTGTTHTLNWSAFDSSGTLIDTPISCLNAANGALTFARPTTISDVLKVSGATNLPTACGGALFIAGNQSGSVSGSIYIGDGTGWSFKIRSRTGSADTDRITITDAGVVTLTSTSASSITLSGGILFDGATTKTIKYTNGTANASVATTLGSVGPTGSTAGDPQGWLRVNIGGTDRYIPYW